MATHTEDEELYGAQARYYLPNSWEEIDRMRNQHEWVKGEIGGLIKAPIDYTAKGLQIMDAATADAFWLYDAHAILPSDAELVGFDIAGQLFPSPERRPQTMKLHVQDLLKSFPTYWQDSFDFVHQRFILPIFDDNEVDLVVAKLVDCLKPGGWVQFVEPNATERVSDPRATWFMKLHDLAKVVMTNPNVAQRLKARLESLGMVNIHHQTFSFGAGSFHDNKELGIRGAKNMKATLEHFMGLTSYGAINMTREEWLKLPAEFENDMKQYKTTVRHHVIWAQKPSNSLYTTLD